MKTPGGRGEQPPASRVAVRQFERRARRRAISPVRPVLISLLLDTVVVIGIIAVVVPLATTTGLPATAGVPVVTPFGFGVVTGGIGVGTLVPGPGVGLGVVITVPVVGAGVLITVPRVVRPRSRPSNPRRVVPVSLE